MSTHETLINPESLDTLDPREDVIIDGSGIVQINGKEMPVVVDEGGERTAVFHFKKVRIRPGVHIRFKNLASVVFNVDEDAEIAGGIHLDGEPGSAGQPGRDAQGGQTGG